MPKQKQPPRDAFDTDTKPLESAMEALIEGGYLLRYYPEWDFVSKWPQLLFYVFVDDKKKYNVLDTELKRLGWRRGKRQYAGDPACRFVKDGVREELWHVVLKNAAEKTEE